MGLKIVLFTLTMCVVQIKSDNCENLEENLRMKRSKYYHYPQRFYRPPPNAYPIKGPYSYTPPPKYMAEDRPLTPSRPPKVSRPEGLGDEDISNLVKYLSKTDLDKIIEFAGEKSEYRPSYKRPKVRVQEIDDEKFNGPFLNPDRPEFNEQSYVRDIQHNPDSTPYDSNPNVNYINEGSQPKLIYSKPPDTENAYNPTYLNSPLEPQETKLSYQLSNSPDAYNNIVKDTNMDKEEQLPKPVNLREYEEYEVSFTNNVPRVVKADSYKLENFGELPVMDYHNSKLHSVSSYNVPHYTITGKHKPTPPSSHVSSSSSNKSPPLELAPQGATGRDQSDAHLKAIKIWTHRSRGTAYTLHDDGTLSLERARPRPYGHP